MTLNAQHHQELLDIANEMATELQCVIHDTDGGGPKTEQTKALLHRYQYLQHKISQDIKEPTQ